MGTYLSVWLGFSKSEKDRQQADQEHKTTTPNALFMSLAQLTKADPKELVQYAALLLKQLKGRSRSSNKMKAPVQSSLEVSLMKSLGELHQVYEFKKGPQNPSERTAFESVNVAYSNWKETVKETSTTVNHYAVFCDAAQSYLLKVNEAYNSTEDVAPQNQPGTETLENVV